MYRFRANLTSPFLIVALFMICMGLILVATFKPMVVYYGQYVSFSLDSDNGVYSPGQAVDLWVRVGGQTDEGITYASSVTVVMKDPSGKTTNLPVTKITDNGRWWNSKFNAPSTPGTYVITVTETGYMGTQSVSGNLYVKTANQTTTNQTSNTNQTSTNQTSSSSSGTNQTSSGTSSSGGTAPSGTPSGTSISGLFDELMKPSDSFYKSLIASGVPESIAYLMSIPAVWIFLGILMIALMSRGKGYIGRYR